MDSFTWITINYHLPMTPSGSRVYAWRKLKELGAVYLRQGVAVLPRSSANLYKAQTIAAKIRAMDGQCTLTEMRFLEEKDHSHMVDAFKAQSTEEFRKLLLEAAQLREHPDGDDKAIRKQYAKAKSRDYFDIEGEIGEAGFFGDFFADLAADSGWNELMSDLRQGCKDVGRMLAELRPEPRHKSEEDEHDDSDI